MEKEKNRILIKSLKSSIKFFRFLVTIFSIFLVITLVSLFGEKIGDYIDANKKTGLVIFLIATITTVAAYGIRELLFRKINELIKYLSVNDEKTFLPKKDLVFQSYSESKIYRNKLIKDNINWLFVTEIFLFISIISLATVIAIYISVPEENKNGLHFFDLSKRQLVTDNHNQFKLIFSFEDGEADVKTFGADEMETLKNFLVSLSACVDNPRDMVKLKVRAFASEKKDSLSEKISELQLANKRALNVGKTIDSLKKEIESDNMNKIMVEIHKWDTIDLESQYNRMIKARIFKEVNTENLNEIDKQMKTAQYLNRRAEIWIDYAGACQ